MISRKINVLCLRSNWLLVIWKSLILYLYNSNKENLWIQLIAELAQWIYFTHMHAVPKIQLQLFQKALEINSLLQFCMIFIKLGQKNFQLKTLLCHVIYNMSSKFINLVFIWVKFQIIMNGLDSIIINFLQVQLWKSVTSIKSPCQLSHNVIFYIQDLLKLTPQKKAKKWWQFCTVNVFTSLLPLGGAFEQCCTVSVQRI